MRVVTANIHGLVANPAVCFVGITIRIALSAIYLEGKPNYAVDKLNRITLAPNERSMGVQFAALDYRGNDEILYQTHFYKEGNEEHPWDAPSKLSQFLVQDLTPGNYIFEVRSTNALGQWQDNTRRLQITVTPTFWESTAGWHQARVQPAPYDRYGIKRGRLCLRLQRPPLLLQKLQSEYRQDSYRVPRELITKSRS